MKRHWYSFAVAGILAASVALAHPAGAALLTQYNPTGSQSPDVSDLPPFMVDSSLTATPLHNVGTPQGGNVNVRPVRAIPGALNVGGGFYIEFVLAPATPGQFIQLQAIKYDYVSYFLGSTFTVSMLTSADGFSSVVDAHPVAGATRALMTFDASSVPPTAGPLTVRFYLHDLVGGQDFGPGFGFVDWADIVSTAADANAVGLSVYGIVTGPVATQSSTWGGIKSLYR